MASAVQESILRNLARVDINDANLKIQLKKIRESANTCGTFKDNGLGKL